MKENLLDALRCPLCRGVLKIGRIRRRSGGEILKGSLVCAGCGEAHPIEGGLPILAPPEVRTDVETIGMEMIRICERLGTKQFAQRLLADTWEPSGGWRRKPGEPAVTPAQVRRGGQYATLRFEKSRGKGAPGKSESKTIEMLDLPKRYRILDLCTGGGYLLCELVKHLRDDHHAIAVDISYESLKFTQGIIRRLGHPDRCAFVVGDARCLPFADAYFDGITSNAGLDHIEGYVRAIDEVSRVLIPGGVFVHAGNTRLTVWGLEDVLTEAEQQSILERQGKPLGEAAVLEALRRRGFGFRAPYREGKWFAVASKK